MATTAEQMVAAIQAALAKNVGVSSVTTSDGQTVTFVSRSAMEGSLRFWKGRVAEEKRQRRRVLTAGLSGSW